MYGQEAGRADIAPESVALALNDYVRAGGAEPEFINQCAQSAMSLVNKYVGSAAVPSLVLLSAYVEVGANLYSRRMSITGVNSYGEPELLGNPHRPALNPLTPAIPILKPFLTPGIA